jgi:hypothetical protein
MFLRELAINIDYLQQELATYRLGLSPNSPDYFQETRTNLLAGIEHYRRMADCFDAGTKAGFLVELERLQQSLSAISLPAA